VASDKVAELLWHKGGPRRSEHPPSVVVAPGESVIAYLWVDLDGKSAAPTQLRHHFSVQREGEAPRVIDAPTTVVRGSAREISSPLRGTDWVAANGPANSSQPFSHDPLQLPLRRNRQVLCSVKYSSAACDSSAILHSTTA